MVLEQVLDFEKEAETIINEAQKKVAELTQKQEKELQNIHKDFETKLAKEKETLKNQLKQKLEAISKDEERQKEDILKKIKAGFAQNTDKAIKIVIENIIK